MTEEDQKTEQENRIERLREYQRQYRIANRETLYQKRRKYIEANREKVAKYHHDYQKANRKKLNAQARARYAKQKPKNSGDDQGS